MRRWNDLEMVPDSWPEGNFYGERVVTSWNNQETPFKLKNFRMSVSKGAFVDIVC